MPAARDDPPCDRGPWTGLALVMIVALMLLALVRERPSPFPASAR